jgi:hypothetical protein
LNILRLYPPSGIASAKKKPAHTNRLLLIAIAVYQQKELWVPAFLRRLFFLKPGLSYILFCSERNTYSAAASALPGQHDSAASGFAQQAPAVFSEQQPVGSSAQAMQLPAGLPQGQRSSTMPSLAQHDSAVSAEAMTALPDAQTVGNFSPAPWDLAQVTPAADGQDSV